MPHKRVRNRNTARGLVIHEGRILLIERWRDGLYYFSIPGGGIEAGEKPENTVRREIYEETSLDVAVERKVYEMPALDGAVNHIFLCRYLSGEPALRPDSEEALSNSLGKNRFKPVWVPVDRLTGLPFEHWSPIRDQLVVDLNTGFDDKVKILVADRDK